MGTPAPVKEHGFAIGGAALACGYLTYAGIARYFGRHFKVVEGGSILGAAAAIALVGEGAHWVLGRSHMRKTELDPEPDSVPSNYAALSELKKADELKALLQDASETELNSILEHQLEKDVNRLVEIVGYIRASSEFNPKMFTIAARFCAQPKHLERIGPVLRTNIHLIYAISMTLLEENSLEERKYFNTYFGRV